MSPTFLIDEPVLIAIGILSALALPKTWGRSALVSRAFWAGSYLALGFIGLAAYGYATAPDWMFMYLIPARAVPFWLIPYALILYYFLFLAGFFLGRELRTLHGALPWLALLLSLIAAVAVTIPLLPAYRVVASYEEFQQGLGVPLAQSTVSRNTLIPTIVLALSGLLGLVWARRQ
ncbi:MAG: hypothetical protein U1F66_08585 [bacterium]